MVQNSGIVYSATRHIERIMLQAADRHQCPVPVTPSIGLACLVANESGSSWLKRADDALYRAKNDGRNCCRLAQPPEA